MARRRNVVKFTASNTETSGARPVAGRKPANGSSTKEEEEEEGEEEEEEEENTLKNVLEFFPVITTFHA